ncbi:MAG: M14 family zinc carboxypeptidase, partial [Thermoanaerobaculia bacterium]
MKKLCALLAAGALLGLTSAQAAGFDFYASGPYREDVPRPEAFLGYELGTLHTHHFRMEDYFEALAAAVPERIELRSYGESYERKRLFIAVITSEENLARIEEIRRRNLTLADPGPTSRTEAEAIAAEAPVLVWLDYGNDGNETANVEAAMQVAYQLVAGESEAARRMRREAVVIVEPDHNPESHDRHVAWYNAFGVGDPEPLAMEHHAPWGMSTNNNHYQIDLNRDAWPLTQRENQAIAVEYLRWRPQVFVDHHGQTENYFFPPPMAPVNPSLPDSHQRWFEEFGRGNAGAFDRYGWQYWVRDVFDLHYPGYWDSWPALHGAIGMTYETDGGGSRGLAWRRRDGSIVTFRDGIARHFVASLATVQTAVKNRQG